MFRVWTREGGQKEKKKEKGPRCRVGHRSDGATSSIQGKLHPSSFTSGQEVYARPPGSDRAAPTSLATIGSLSSQSRPVPFPPPPPSPSFFKSSDLARHAHGIGRSSKVGRRSGILESVLPNPPRPPQTSSFSQSRSSYSGPFFGPLVSSLSRNSGGTVGMYLRSRSRFTPPKPAP